MVYACGEVCTWHTANEWSNRVTQTNNNNRQHRNRNKELQHTEAVRDKPDTHHHKSYARQQAQRTKTALRDMIETLETLHATTAHTGTGTGTQVAATNSELALRTTHVLRAAVRALDEYIVNRI